MIIKYKLDKYTPKGFKFKFENGKYTIINLSKYFKNYKLPNYMYSDKYWHYTVIEILNHYDNVNNFEIGDVILFNIEIIRYKFYTKEGVIFRKTKLYELDYYEYKNNINSDNAKVYKEIKNLFEVNNKRNIRETMI